MPDVRPPDEHRRVIRAKLKLTAPGDEGVFREVAAELEDLARQAEAAVERLQMAIARRFGSASSDRGTPNAL